MHISEGVLSLPVIAAGWTGAVALTAFSLKKTPVDKISRVAVIAAIFFVASLIRVPIGVTSMHLTLLGLTGVMLGFSSTLAIIAALLLQALLFQFGGIISLGVNIVIMGSSAIMGYIIFKLPHGGKIFPVVAFLSGFGAVIWGTILMMLALYFSNGNFVNTAKLLGVAQLPLALVEGVVTVFILTFIKKVNPAMLDNR